MIQSKFRAAKNGQRFDRFHNRLPRTRPVPEIARETGPLDVIRSKRILVIADVPNLEVSCKHLGYQLSWRTLGQRLRDAAGSASLYAVFSRSSPDDTRKANYFVERSWKPYAKTIRMVNRPGGHVERDSNADFHVAYLCGHLAGRLSLDWVILASGDGSLARDLSSCLVTLKSSPKVATLSVAGATSQQLDARVCGDLIRENLEVGRDVMYPMSSRTSAAI